MIHSLRLHVILFAAALLSVTEVAAQSNAVMLAGEEYGLETGYLFPNQVHGVREIMPVWGGHYSYGVGSGMIEPSFFNSNARGSNYTLVSVGYRGDINLGSFLAYYGGGPSWHYYTERDEKKRISVLGGYTQLGAMIPLSQNVFFNGNFRFFVSPGTVLYVGFGFVFRFGG